MKIKPIILLLLLTGLWACQETLDIFLGIPLQPKIEENNYQPGLNIFGILRPDSTSNFNNSFVHVQKVAPAVDNYPEFTADSLIVKDAIVNIGELENAAHLFSYTTHNNLFTEPQYRPSEGFKVEAGKKYSIACEKEELPLLSSATIVPEKPEIVSESIIKTEKNLYFEITADSSAFMYDVIAYSNNVATNSQRIVSLVYSNTPVIIMDSKIDRLEIYAYDYNLADYFATSNTSLNFNKYRKTFGNVKGGYGVFGSLNFALYFPE
jgi:hypothetical protein